MYPEEDVVHRERQSKRHRFSTSPRRQIPFLREPVFLPTPPIPAAKTHGTTLHNRPNRTTADQQDQTLLAIRLRLTSYRRPLVPTPTAASTTSEPQLWAQRRERDGKRGGHCSSKAERAVGRSEEWGRRGAGSGGPTCAQKDVSGLYQVRRLLALAVFVFRFSMF
jgi:hypothetical protein